MKWFKPDEALPIEGRIVLAYIKIHCFHDSENFSYILPRTVALDNDCFFCVCEECDEPFEMEQIQCWSEIDKIPKEKKKKKKAPKKRLSKPK